MVYKVVVTKDAEEDLDSFIRYLLFEKKISKQLKVCLMILRIQKSV